MEYVKHLSIKNFRGIADLQYAPKQINIIIGKNNAGKSTLLDAVRYTLSHKIQNESENYTYEVKTNASIAEISTNTDICLIYPNKNDATPQLLKKASDTLRDAIHTVCVKLEISEDELPDIENKIANLLPYNIAEFNKTPQILFNTEKIITADQKLIATLSDLLNPSDKKTKTTQTNLAEPGTQYNQKTTTTDSTPHHTTAKQRNNRNIATAYQFLYMLFDAVNTPTNPAPDKVVFCGCNNDCSTLRITDSIRLIQLENIIKEHHILQNVERLTNEGVVYQSENDLVMIPYSSHGSGFVTLLNLIDKMYTAKGGVFLIEEPENHMHPGYLSVFVKQLITLAVKLNIQVFMTTHSADLIEEFANYPNSSTSDKDILQIASIIRRNSTHEIYTYSPKEARQMMNELLIDLRGA